MGRVAALLAEAERPVIMAGTGLYWGRGEESLRALAEAVGIPVFLNGLGRGCLPADHQLALSSRDRIYRTLSLPTQAVSLVRCRQIQSRLGDPYFRP